MSYAQGVGPNKPVLGILRRLFQVTSLVYFALLLFFLIVANCGLVFRYEPEYFSSFLLYLFLFAPSIIFAFFASSFKQTWIRILCWFCLVVTGIGALGLAVIGSLFCVTETKNYVFSRDRVVRVSVSEDVFSVGHTNLSVGQAWGPLFYKMRCTAVSQYPTIGKEIDGKVKLEYTVDSKPQVRDLDDLLAGKPF